MKDRFLPWLNELEINLLC